MTYWLYSIALSADPQLNTGIGGGSQKELGWVLDDAVAAARDSGRASGTWQPASWQSLNPERSRSDGVDPREVRLRLSVPQLQVTLLMHLTIKRKLCNPSRTLKSSLQAVQSRLRLFATTLFLLHASLILEKIC